MKYESAEGTLTFSNGVSVNKSEMERGGFGPLAHTIFSFSSSLSDMKVDDSQFALLSAVCLLASGELSAPAFKFISLWACLIKSLLLPLWHPDTAFLCF